MKCIALAASFTTTIASAIQNCERVDGVNPKKCTACARSFYLREDREACLACSINGCDVCSSADQCLLCRDGFNLTADHRCMSCSAGCRRCTQDSRCTECFDRFFMVASGCQACLPGCSKCSNTLECSECAQSYFLTANKTCASCGNGCDSCEVADSCRNCQKYFSLRGGKCLAYPSGCESLSEAGSCAQCRRSYYLLREASECRACPANCSECSSGQTCSECVVGTALDGGLCYACPANCAACERGVCRSCASGYRIWQEQDMTVICSRGSTLLAGVLRGSLVFVLATVVLHLLVVTRIFLLFNAFCGWLCPCCFGESDSK